MPHPELPEKTKHQSHPKEYTCPHTKLVYCNPCDAVECPGCGMEWAGGSVPKTDEPKEHVAQAE
jgi:hypothetical protein